MADIRKTVSVVFTGDSSDVQRSINSLSKSLETIAPTAQIKQLSQDIDGVGEAAGRASKNTELLNTSLKAFATGALVKEFIDANLSLEKFEKTMTIVTGSSQGAADAFAYVREVSNRLGIDVNKTAEIFAKFSAATKGTAVEGRDSVLIFEAFSKAILATGGNTNDVAGAFTQLTQGISKGRFELEDLKSIAERVPGFFTTFAESLGVTTEQLFKLISAGQIGTTEILQFAQTLDQSFKGVDVKGFEAELTRLRNTLNDLYIKAGEAGAFKTLTKGIEGITLAAIGASAAFVLVGETIANVAITSESRKRLGWEEFAQRLDESLQKAANSVRPIRDKFFELQDDAAKALSSTVSNTDKLPKSFEKAGESAKQLDASLKALGLNPDQFREPVEKVIEAFAKLATNADATSEAIISGLLVSLTKVSDPDIINALGQYAISALEAKGNTEGLAAVTNALAEAKKGAIPKIDEYSKAIKASQEAQKQAAKEAKEAEEKAFKLRLELEKLASNERIKQIEFKVQLDIAKVQADTEKFKLTLESLNQGLKSTGEVINAAFGALSGVGGFYGLEKLDIIRTQLEQENKFRKDQFDLQKALVEEQVKRLRAQTEAIGRGDALIKIDGSGLAPQLEAFMWEILRAIQVRVNRDGLPILLGI